MASSAPSRCRTLPQPKAMLSSLAMPTIRPFLPRTMSSIVPIWLVSEDHAAETAERIGEVYTADDDERDELQPDHGEARAAIEHGLREPHEMRCRTDDLHHVLQPDGHALHRRAGT